MIISLLTVLFFSKSEALPSLNSSQVFRTTPSWQEVECRYDTKTKYLFSELSLTWEEAKGECQLYGGLEFQALSGRNSRPVAPKVSFAHPGWSNQQETGRLKTLRLGTIWGHLGPFGVICNHLGSLVHACMSPPEPP